MSLSITHEKIYENLSKKLKNKIRENKSKYIYIQEESIVIIQMIKINVRTFFLG